MTVNVQELKNVLCDLEVFPIHLLSPPRLEAQAGGEACNGNSRLHDLEGAQELSSPVRADRANASPIGALEICMDNLDHMFLGCPHRAAEQATIDTRANAG